MTRLRLATLRACRAVLSSAVLLLGAVATNAATITVNSFLDDGVNCTLRKAVENANGTASHAACTLGTSPSNTVVLGTGTYLLTQGFIDLVGRNITISGNGAANTIIDGQNLDFVLDNFDGVTAITITLQNLTITRGRSPGLSGFEPAGAMYINSDATAILSGVAFTNSSTGASGGAISNDGTLTVNNSTFSGNSATEGGAIRSVGAMTITNSTFSGNSATRGGAIFHAGNTVAKSLNITNATFSGNTATSRGGAIAATNGAGSVGAITLTQVTIASNAVTGSLEGGGGVDMAQTGAFNLDRSVIANNTSAGTGADCRSTSSFTSLNYNVIGSATGCSITGTTTNNFVGAALLNALASNGGPTQTISLQAYSPARDRAPTCATGTDQRGTARPLGTACDSGAFEASPTVAQAPTIGTATAGNAQASVAFTAPANNGGAAVTSYTATSSPSGITASGSASPLVVTGLTNGTAYTFMVTATNSVGTSAASSSSNSVTPIGPPGAPTIGTATSGNAQASITFTPPASNGGSAITGYTATSNPGGFTASGAGSPLVVTGLTNGTAYTFSVTAANAVGTSAASSASNSVTPKAPQTITFNALADKNLGDAPFGVSASASSGLTVSFASQTTGVCTTGGTNGSMVTLVTTGTCTIRASQAGNAAYEPAPNVDRSFTVNAAPIYTLVVAKDGSGAGTVSGSGIDCGVDCTENLANGTAVTLTATAASGSVFASWTNCPSASGNQCNFTMTSGITVTATFTALIVYNITLDGAQETPASGSAATGTGVITIDTVNNTLSYNITFSGLGSAETMAHIHGFAARGATAGVLHTLPVGSPKVGTWSYTQGQEADILAGLTYVNIHTVNFSGGEIRGQIDDPPASGTTPVLDFNGDGKRDVLLQNVNGALYVWHVDGASISGGNVTITTSGNLPQLTGGWDVFPGVADFNGDGKADILLANSNGALYVWMIDGAAIAGGNLSIPTSGNLPVLPTGWSVAGTGDFNGDGKSDILLKHTNGALYVWMIDGATITGGNVAIPSSGNLPQLTGGWSFGGIGDFNGDGKSDIVLMNTNGALYAWMIDGSVITAGEVSIASSGNLPQLTGGWGFAGTGDFDGDGKSDIVLQNTNGALYVWMIDGASIVGGNVSIPSSGNLPQLTNNWTLAGIGDFSGTGKGGILLYNTASEALYVWMVDGAAITAGFLTITTSGNLPTLSGGWQSRFME